MGVDGSATQSGSSGSGSSAGDVEWCPQPAPPVRSPWRRRAARWVFATIIVAQAALILRGYHDPHKFFAYQPFNESDTWRADLFRVTVDGQELPVVDGAWLGYSWDELVGTVRLSDPSRLRHADSGAAATIDFLDEALDWVADHTPTDTETWMWRAEVTWYRNTRGPFTTMLTSDPREEAG